MAGNSYSYRRFEALNDIGEQVYFQDYLLSDKNPYEDSENVSLWTVEWCLLGRLFVEMQNNAKDLYSQMAAQDDREWLTLVGLYKLIDRNGKWHPVPDHSKFTDERFSRDNMIAVTSIGLLTNRPIFAKAGIEAFDFPKYMQPQDIIYFLYCYGFWPIKILLPFLYLNIFWACWSVTKCKDGSFNTDGRLLSFVRLQAMKKKSWMVRNIVWPIADNLVRISTWKYLDKHPEEIPYDKDKLNRKKDHWKVIFHMYFTDRNHPNNTFCRMIWQ